MPFAPIFSTQAAEVKVDRETGKMRVVRFVQAQDVGVAINPMAVEGQIDGGAVQGIGRAISEEVVIKDGEILNPSLTTYLMPMAADVPALKTSWCRCRRTMVRLARAPWPSRRASDPRRRSPTPLRTPWACVSKSYHSAPRKSCGRSTVSHRPRSSWIPTCCSSSGGCLGRASACYAFCTLPWGHGGSHGTSSPRSGRPGRQAMTRLEAARDGLVTRTPESSLRR